MFYGKVLHVGTGELSSGGVRKGVGILEDYRCSGHRGALQIK